MAQKQQLTWSTILASDMSDDTRTSLELFIDAKADLERRLAAEAIAAGAAPSGSTFAFAYRGLPNNVGMAITGRSQRSTGFAGLAKPTATLATYQAQQDGNGYRR